MRWQGMRCGARFSILEFPQFYLKGGSHREEHGAAFGRNQDSSSHRGHREVQEFNRGLRGLRGLILTTNEHGYTRIIPCPRNQKRETVVAVVTIFVTFVSLVVKNDNAAVNNFNTASPNRLQKGTAKKRGMS